MNTIKSLLLPLALVFAAIAIFEFGARYGASNMRGHAIASEMQFPLSVYTQTGSTMDAATKATFEQIIDNGIAAASLHRRVWHLDKMARAQLNKALKYALSIRGQQSLQRFTGDNVPNLGATQAAEIQSAIRLAYEELIENAETDATAQAPQAAAN